MTHHNTYLPAMGQNEQTSAQVLTLRTDVVNKPQITITHTHAIKVN
jgi:hypothetical protein